MSPEVAAFREALIEGGWLDGAYSQEEGVAHLHGERALCEADVAPVQRLLLFVERGEYWGGGVWAACRRDGFVYRLVARLAKIQAASPPSRST